MIGQLRAGYGRNVGDPAWTHFIRTLGVDSRTVVSSSLQVTNYSRRSGDDNP